MYRSYFSSDSRLATMGSMPEPIFLSGVRLKKNSLTSLSEYDEKNSILARAVLNLNTGKALGNNFVHFDISAAISHELCLLECFPRKDP